MPNRGDMNEALKIHTRYDESESDSGKSELDEQYYQNKPPPLYIPPAQTVVIRPMNHQYEYLPQQPTTSWINHNFNPYYNHETCSTENINYNQTGRPKQYPAQITTQPATQNSPKNKRNRLPPRFQKKLQEKKANKTTSINDNRLQRNVVVRQVDDLSVNCQFACAHAINKLEKTRISEKTNSPKNSHTVFPTPSLNQVNNQSSKNDKPEDTNEERKNGTLSCAIRSTNVAQFSSNSTPENVNDKGGITENSFWDGLANCLCLSLCCCFC